MAQITPHCLSEAEIQMMLEMLVGKDAQIEALFEHYLTEEKTATLRLEDKSSCSLKK